MKQVFKMQHPVLPPLCARRFKPGSEQGFLFYMFEEHPPGLFQMPALEDFSWLHFRLIAILSLVSAI